MQPSRTVICTKTQAQNNLSYLSDRKSLRALPMGTTAMPNPAHPVSLQFCFRSLPTAGHKTASPPTRPYGSWGLTATPCYSAVCRNLGRGGIGFEATARIEAETVIEFELEQVVDEPMRYWVRILFRENSRYGGYYVNDDDLTSAPRIDNWLPD
jgi:hypothetical protein